ncbi:unnamed protein product [Boreogadus saida]
MRHGVAQTDVQGEADEVTVDNPTLLHCTLRYPEIQIQVSEAPSGLRRLPLTEDLSLTPGTTTPSTPDDQNPIAILLATPCYTPALKGIYQPWSRALEQQ